MSLLSNLISALTDVATDIKQVATWLNGDMADLSGLDTQTKASLVAAINEVLAAVADASGIDDDATSTSSSWSSSKTSTQINTAVTAGISELVDGAPTALDTLREIATALQDSDDEVAALVTQLDSKQPLNSELTAIATLTSAANKMLYATGAGTWALSDLTPFARGLLDDTTAAAARSTLGVYSATEIGDVEADLVAIYRAARG